jgi:hypothetical protein
MEGIKNFAVQLKVICFIASILNMSSFLCVIHVGRGDNSQMFTSFFIIIVFPPFTSHNFVWNYGIAVSVIFVFFFIYLLFISQYWYSIICYCDYRDYRDHHHITEILLKVALSTMQKRCEHLRIISPSNMDDT